MFKGFNLYSFIMDTQYSNSPPGPGPKWQTWEGGLPAYLVVTVSWQGKNLIWAICLVHNIHSTIKVRKKKYWTFVLYRTLTKISNYTFTVLKTVPYRTEVHALVGRHAVMQIPKPDRMNIGLEILFSGSRMIGTFTGGYVCFKHQQSAFAISVILPVSTHMLSKYHGFKLEPVEINLSYSFS